MLKWSAPEYSYHYKDVAWYAAVIGLAAILVLIALWQGNFLFIIFIVVAAITLISWGRREPTEIEFEIYDDGLRIGSEKFAKGQFDGFSVSNYTKEWGKLYLKKSGRFSRYIMILVPQDLVDKVKQQCLNQWTVITRKESLVDELSDFFGF